MSSQAAGLQLPAVAQEDGRFVNTPVYSLWALDCVVVFMYLSIDYLLICPLSI